MFVDLNIKGKDLESNINMANEAIKLGWQQLNFSYSQNDYKKSLEFKEDLEDKLDIPIDFTLEIDSNNPNEIRKIVKKYRKNCNCISVVGGNLKVNRAVCEDIQIDILSRPYLKRYDAGMNHVLAKLAYDNNIAVELSFKDILNSYLSNRAKILANWKEIYTLYRKFEFPFIISSHAESVFDLRSVRDIQAFLISTGLKEEEISKMMDYPKDIIEYNKNRENLIFKGVKVVSQ
ncbi:MAG: ribonuclease P [archaeon]|nr:ribonuclease P [archaeon]MCQ2972223.1 ribonuclease P [archaeon]